MRTVVNCGHTPSDQGRHDKRGDGGLAAVVLAGGLIYGAELNPVGEGSVLV